MALSEPWYHDFSVLGFPTPQKQGIFPANQKAKVGPLFELIRDAIRRTPGDCVELFCADALFGIYALQQGASSLLGVDIGLDPAGGMPVHLEQARIAADVLDVGDRATFEIQDAWDLQGTFDIGICAGGLYHVTDPKKLLEKLRENVAGTLVVQTVYSLENTDPDYFEASPPFRPHGSIFSATWMLNTIQAAGWSIVKRMENELPGNPELRDRGSLYALIERDPK